MDNALLERLEEELEDACTYFHLFEEADKNGNEYLAKGFWLIGREELSHAEFAYMSIERMGKTVPDDLREKWEKTAKKYK